jgi:hypothetical protein
MRSRLVSPDRACGRPELNRSAETHWQAFFDRHTPDAQTAGLCLVRDSLLLLYDDAERLAAERPRRGPALDANVPSPLTVLLPLCESSRHWLRSADGLQVTQKELHEEHKVVAEFDKIHLLLENMLLASQSGH